MDVRGILFCFILAVVCTPGICIMAYLYGSYVLRGDVIALWLSRSVPIVARDVSFVGEVTPVAMAAALAALAPEKNKITLFYAALIFSIIGWSLYLFFTLLLDDPHYRDALLTILDQADGHAQENFSVLSSLVTAARTFYLAVGGGLLGFKLRS